MDEQKLANKAHERRESFIKIHHTTNVIKIKLLYEIWINEDWSILGFDSFKELCSAPYDAGGLNISYSWANQVANIYERYVEQLGQDPQIIEKIGPKKLYLLKNLVNEDNVEDMVSLAQANSTDDLKLTILEEKEKIYGSAHIHQWYCRHCKKFLNEVTIENGKELL